ncbi:MAG: hypothetical protein LBQ79_12405 [Deltaproteobacteria bacterium]|nr:hypothetical protein [Deltaproteobacteria bacterium]
MEPHATDIYTFSYRGGETATATVTADSRYDLYLYVYDDSGNLVSYDTDTASMGICAWYPVSPGDYFLAVKNTTGSHVSYQLYTN